MKPMMRHIALFMTVVLSISSVSALQASYWDDWQKYVQMPSMESISHLIDKETAKKLLLLPTVAAALVGAYYWIGKKGGTQEKKFDREILSSLIMKTQITEEAKPHPEQMKKVSAEKAIVVEPLKQLKVYGQFNSDGGGGASCGYHTLLRSMQLVAGLSRGEVLEEIEKTLQSPDMIAIYFGKGNKARDILPGEWRQRIITYRQQKCLKNILHEKLVSALTTQDPKTREIYGSAFGTIENMVKQFLNEDKDFYKPIDFSDKALKQYIRMALSKLKHEGNLEQVEQLEGSVVMTSAIDFDKIRAAISAQESTFTVDSLLSDINAKLEENHELTGEWLDDGEVEYLWNYEQEMARPPIIPHRVQCGFKTIANFEFVGQADIDELTPYIEEFVKPEIAEQGQRFYIFALGTMRQDGDQHGTRGHWYPLVLHKKSDGSRTYYVMDSMGSSRLDDSNVNSVIRLIEEQAQ